MDPPVFEVIMTPGIVDMAKSSCQMGQITRGGPFWKISIILIFYILKSNILSVENKRFFHFSL